MSEIWRPCGGNYEVSDSGNVRNPHKVLKKSVKRNGYEFVVINVDGKWKGKYVHRLVWESFNGPIPEGLEVNHKDEDKSNNALDNLELVTHKYNCNYGTRNERSAKALRQNVIGPAYLQYDSDGKLVARFKCLKEASASVNGAKSNICAAAKRENNFAYGYFWRTE